MSIEHIKIFSIIIIALMLFAWGRFRHDIVAIFCLVMLILTRLVSPDDAFKGFSHPAVVTVAVILVISKALENSGLIDFISRRVLKLGNNFILQLGALCLITAIASGFMNNVGALALLMPVAIKVADKSEKSPSVFLMPIAFSSLLGGMMTLIGTPPNIIISAFRYEYKGEAYNMFDFAKVGSLLVLIGLTLMVVFLWRLLPSRIGKNKRKKLFNIEEYITELYVIEDSKVEGKSLGEVREMIEADIQILKIIRANELIQAPNILVRLKEGDILFVEAEPDNLEIFIEKSGVRLVGQGELEDKEKIKDSEGIVNVEAVITGESLLVNQSATSINMRSRFSVNLLAISRQGRQIRKRISQERFKIGDVLLLQGNRDKIDLIIQNMTCLPLADRGINIGKPKKLILALLIFTVAIALIITDVLMVDVAFTVAALAMVLTKVIAPKDIYTSIDWPVIVLLGAMLPLGLALEETGGAKLLGDWVLLMGKSLPISISLFVLFVVTMLLSNIINNAATVVLMAPIGYSIARGLGVSVDPFLMCISVASSSAFLTPIGHQSNTLVMGPGGYNFSDYTKMGLPLSIVIAIVSIPIIMFFWPL